MKIVHISLIISKKQTNYFAEVVQYNISNHNQLQWRKIGKVLANKYHKH